MKEESESLELKHVCLSPFPFFIALFISTFPLVVFCPLRPPTQPPLNPPPPTPREWLMSVAPLISIYGCISEALVRRQVWRGVSGARPTICHPVYWRQEPQIFLPPSQCRPCLGNAQQRHLNPGSTARPAWLGG